MNILENNVDRIPIMFRIFSTAALKKAANFLITRLGLGSEEDISGGEAFEGDDPVTLYGGFLKWWYPTTMGFPTKNDHFGGCLGVPLFKETPI